MLNKNGGLIWIKSSGQAKVSQKIHLYPLEVKMQKCLQASDENDQIADMTD